jgi:hypothetical protein
MAPRQPLDLTEGPGAFGLHFGRTLLAPVLEQAGEQHRAVVDHIRLAYQRFGQAFKRQVGVR